MPILLRGDFDAARLRVVARESEGADQMRRLLADGSGSEALIDALLGPRRRPPSKRNARRASNLLRSMAPIPFNSIGSNTMLS